MADGSVPPQIVAAAQKVSDSLGADIVLFSGAVFPEGDRNLNDLVRNRKRKKNVLFMLSTFGGLADCAYRITRCLQECYKQGEVILFVDSFCKSAGTLIAVGASEIVMSERAEFGPLDVQLKKPDEIDERASGLTPMQAMFTLRNEAYKSFSEFFVSIRHETRITSKTAAEIASNLALGLFRPIYQQIEPMRMGENERAMQVAEAYGNRLQKMHSNLKTDALQTLITGYPSHEFVIDRTEAGDLFKRLRSPNPDEQHLASLVRQTARESLYSEQNSLVHFFDLADGTESDDNDEGAEENRPKEPPQGGSDNGDQG